jgi:hypothetical protein
MLGLPMAVGPLRELIRNSDKLCTNQRNKDTEKNTDTV